MRLGGFIKESGIVAATTLGAGIFALPYVFAVSGWLTGLFYLCIFSIIIILVHFIYFRVLEKIREKNRLLGLIRTYLGSYAFGFGIFVVLAGLVLTLVVYLILGSQFIKILFPNLSPVAATLIFWLLATTPFLFKERRSVLLETGGIALMAAAIVFIFFTSNPSGALAQLKIFDVKNIFLPFGAIFFSLAGWTAIEPVYGIEEDAKKNLTIPGQPYLAMICGTTGTALLYLMFVMGILGSVLFITPDTISALVGWQRFKIIIIGVLGLSAIWTSYLPIGLEIKNSLESDLSWKPLYGLVLVAFLPPMLFLLGLNNFLKVIGLVGGVFVSLQYLFIVLVGKKVLDPPGIKKLLFHLASAIFILAAAYEIYYFIVG
ncbi:MAG: hypothetical protein KGJ89_01170 [Patescibacteria group bacterium]|nr:amino acid transporter [Patescibacteria group bacterium]MDE2015122.1 hypothetical protein [Patescibacteria group bacterium]MDE2226550.1 hypothetical protein [Patescibacteria group bacterium]